MITICTIAIAAIIHWGKDGNSQLVENWHLAQPGSGSAIAKQIFFGASLGFIGNTGTNALERKLKARF